MGVVLRVSFAFHVLSINSRCFHLCATLCLLSLAVHAAVFLEWLLSRLIRTIAISEHHKASHHPSSSKQRQVTSAHRITTPCFCTTSHHYAVVLSWSVAPFSMVSLLWCLVRGDKIATLITSKIPIIITTSFNVYFRLIPCCHSIPLMTIASRSVFGLKKKEHSSQSQTAHSSRAALRRSSPGAACYLYCVVGCWCHITALASSAKASMAAMFGVHNRTAAWTVFFSC